MMQSVLESALRLAELGYRVFPCSPGEKRPLAACVPNGVLGATTDEETLTRWWTDYPAANLAIATDGLLVVDIDGADNPWLKDEPEKLLDLAAGAVAFTARGGRHYVFRQPAGRQLRNTTSKLADKVDTRANGGYVLVAPSEVEGRSYHWSAEGALDGPPESLPEPPDWLLALLEPGNLVPSRTDHAQPAGALQEGQRNSYLTRLAGSMRRRGQSENEIRAALLVANRERCRPPLSDKEVETIAWSVSRYEPDAGAVATVEGTKQPTIERAQPFPVGALPEPVCGFVREAAAAIGCDVSYVGVPLLACLARAIGNTRTIQLKSSWHEPAVVWGAIVGKSGTHKSPALQAATTILERRQAEAIAEHTEALAKFEQERAFYERDYKAWQRSKMTLGPAPELPEEPHCRRYICGDATIEALAVILAGQQDGVLVVRDELAGWLDGMAEYKGGKGSDTAHWLSCWSGGSMTVDRKTGIKRMIHIPRAAVSIVGGIQPGILRRAIGREHMQDGLCARLLLTMPESRDVRWTEATIDEETEADLAGVFDKLLSLQAMLDENGNPEPQAMPLTPQAKAVWIDYYDRHRAEMRGLNDDLAAAWSKLEAYAARFALIAQLCSWAAGEGSSERVDQEAVEAGIRLSDWFGSEARRVYDLLAGDEESETARDLVALVRRRGGAATARDLMRTTSRYRTAEAAEAALDTLAKDGLGVWETVPPGPRGGQPKRLLRLVDTLDIDTTPEKPGESEVVSSVNASMAPDCESLAPVCVS